MKPSNIDKESANRDPLSGAPGAHPIGTAIGAAAGGIAAGAAAGTLAAGPIGTAVGAAIGAVAGGLGGKTIAEHYDPTVEEAHWRDRFEREPYFQGGMTFDDYAPAYRLGGESRSRIADKSFEDVEDQLADRYDQVRGESRLDWDDAREATRAGWNRLASPAARND
jgi:uncharacterized protein YcfJ